MMARWLPNGGLLIPKRAEGPNGEIGDGMVEVQPGSPEFAEWEAWADGPRPGPDMAAFDADLLTLETALAEARLADDGAAMDRLQTAIAAAEAAFEGRLVAFWDAEQHPRGEGGKFAPKEGGDEPSPPPPPGGGTGASAPGGRLANRNTPERLSAQIQRWKNELRLRTERLTAARTAHDPAAQRAAVADIARAAANIQRLGDQLDAVRGPQPPSGGPQTGTTSSGSQRQEPPAQAQAQQPYQPPPLQPITTREHAEHVWNMPATASHLGARVTTFSGDSGFALVHGEVVDHTGRAVGTFDRSINNASGEIGHSLFTIRPGFQGSGFGNTFNQQSFDRYRELGFTRVTVHANINVGGYTWARQGFDFQNASGRDHGMRLLDQHAARMTRAGLTQEEQAPIRREIAALQARMYTPNPPTAYEMSQVGHAYARDDTLPNGHPTQTWLGKEAFLGAHWYGEVKLQEQHPHVIPHGALFADGSAMTAASSALLMAVYHAWVQAWLAKDGEPPLTRAYPPVDAQTEGDGQYELNAFCADATAEQEADFQRRLADAGWRPDRATFPGGA